MTTSIDEVRDRIVERAEAVFLAHGYSRVTMDDLAAELRMSKKTLYRHFSRKEDLALAALEANFARASVELNAILEDPRLDFDARLQALVRLVIGRFARSITVLRDFQRDAPALWHRLEALRHEVVQARFSELLSSGVEDGVLRSDLDLRLVLQMVLTLIDGLMRPDVLADLEMSAEQVYPRMLSILLDGMRAERAGRGTTARPRALARRK